MKQLFSFWAETQKEAFSINVPKNKTFPAKCFNGRSLTCSCHKLLIKLCTLSADANSFGGSGHASLGLCAETKIWERVQWLLCECVINIIWWYFHIGSSIIFSLRPADINVNITAVITSAVINSWINTDPLNP